MEPNKTIKARYMAMAAHEGQMYGKENYFKGHLVPVVHKVANLFATTSNLEYLIMLAYLHDILEDTKIPYDEIVLEFGKDVAGDVKDLTRNSGEPYICYIDRICGNPVAAKVKYADSLVNLEKCLETKEFKRAEKYLRNLQQLSDYV